MNTKRKGFIAEICIAADIALREYEVAWPTGNMGDQDLLVLRHCRCDSEVACYPYCKPNRWETVQVKYGESKDGVLKVRNLCHSVTAGRVSSTRIYGENDIDWLAAFDMVTKKCYYIPSSELDGKGLLHLRLNESKNGQASGVRWAKDYEDF